MLWHQSAYSQKNYGVGYCGMLICSKDGAPAGETTFPQPGHHLFFDKQKSGNRIFLAIVCLYCETIQSGQVMF